MGAGAWSVVWLLDRVMREAAEAGGTAAMLDASGSACGGKTMEFGAGVAAVASADGSGGEQGTYTVDWIDAACLGTILLRESIDSYEGGGSCA